MTSQEYCFVATIENLQIDEPMGSSWNIDADLNITNSPTIAKRIVNPTLYERAGKMEADDILSGEPFVYAIGSYPNDDDSAKTQMKMLMVRLRIAVTFCNVLWIIKDNTVNVGRGFLQYPFIKTGTSRVSLNSWIVRFSDASGGLGCSSFSKDEIRTAISMYKRLFPETTIDDISDPIKPSRGEKIDRLSRAFYFLQAARASDDLPGKIAYYCTCFEALVSTNPIELAHQVAERVAVLIGRDSQDSLEVYRNLKRAYSTRSKLVHGDNLTATNERYGRESLLCDDYLRRLLTLVVSDAEVNQGIEQTSQNVDGFFLEKLFNPGQ